MKLITPIYYYSISIAYTVPTINETNKNFNEMVELIKEQCFEFILA